MSNAISDHCLQTRAFTVFDDGSNTPNTICRSSGIRRTRCMVKASNWLVFCSCKWARVNWSEMRWLTFSTSHVDAQRATSRDSKYAILSPIFIWSSYCASAKLKFYLNNICRIEIIKIIASLKFRIRPCKTHLFRLLFTVCTKPLTRQKRFHVHN